MGRILSLPLWLRHGLRRRDAVHQSPRPRSPPPRRIGRRRVLAALKRAASSFPGVSLGANGRARAYLVENDWAMATNGEEFAQRLGADAPALMLLRLCHTVIVENLAVRLGWR